MLTKRKKEKNKALTVGNRGVYRPKALPNQRTCEVNPCGEKSEELSIFSAFILLSELNSTRNTVALLRDISIGVCDHKKLINRNMQ